MVKMKAGFIIVEPVAKKPESKRLGEKEILDPLSTPFLQENRPRK
jgi:hypothetical protein